MENGCNTYVVVVVVVVGENDIYQEEEVGDNKDR
jgi:hypothetical protein